MTILQEEFKLGTVEEAESENQVQTSATVKRFSSGNRFVQAHGVFRSDVGFLQGEILTIRWQTGEAESVHSAQLSATIR